MPFKLSDLTKLPNTQIWIVRQNDNNSYRVFDKNDPLIEYMVSSKTATTSSHYFLTKKTEIIAEVEQDKIQNKYQLRINKEDIAQVSFESNQITIDFINEYIAKPEIRAKTFDFYDNNKNLVMTIDKRFSIKDRYQIVYLERINKIIPILVTISIDDFYHSGLKH